MEILCDKTYIIVTAIHVSMSIETERQAGNQNLIEISATTTGCMCHTVMILLLYIYCYTGSCSDLLNCRKSDGLFILPQPLIPTQPGGNRGSM